MKVQPAILWDYMYMAGYTCGIIILFYLLYNFAKI